VPVAAAGVRPRSSRPRPTIICTVYLGARADLKGRVGYDRVHTLNFSRVRFMRDPRKWTAIFVIIRSSRFILSTVARGVLKPRCGISSEPKRLVLVSDEHIVAEIGQVLAGEIEGRRSARGDHRLTSPSATSSKTWRARWAALLPAWMTAVPRKGTGTRTIIGVHQFY